MLRTSWFVRCGLAALFVALASCGGPAHSDGGSDGPADARLDAVGIDSTVDVAVDTGMPGAFGARCVNDVECASGICLFNGRCSRTCAGATDCPTSSNWHCVGLPGRGTVCDCTPTAATDTPCNRIDDDCNGVVDDGSQTCNGTCVDVYSDRANCGACGITCGGGSTCQAGHCACPPGQTTVCGTRCVSTDTDPMNCGGCGNVCPGGTSATASCVAGRCALACAAGAGDCDGNPANGCEADTRSSLMNCGMCGTACAFAHAGAACSTGSCVMGACTTGFANCDGDPSNGCETDPTTSTANCGACGRACAPANGIGLCAAGACDLAACNAGFANCDGSAANGCEAQLQTDARNCGTCGRVCPGLGTPNTTATCAAGACATACSTGYGDCDGVTTNGCETGLLGNAAHCGACGTVCGAGLVCSGGTCGLPCAGTGRTLCGASCVDLSTDPANCGACGAPCAAPRVCSAATCSCPAGLTFCGGTCVNLAVDPSNCGVCGSPCPAPRFCSGGSCGCAPGLTFCGGACVSLTTDARNCGTCGNMCAAGQSCVAGACVGTACVPTGNACTMATECCTASTSCRPRISSAYACCFESGRTCASDAQCCGRMTCTGSGGTCACRAAGLTCAANADCCSGSLCQAGVCTTGGTCGTVGSTCSGATCCTGMVCQGGVCTRPYCAGRGGQCGTGYPCCTGLMCGGFGGCVLPGSCGASGASCTGNADCCSNFCFGTSCL